MDTNSEKIRAKSQLRFSILVLFCMAVIGAWFEYVSYTQPLDEINVLYVPQVKQQSNQPQQVTPPAQPQPAEEPAPVEQKPEPVAAPAPETPAVNDAHPQAAAELLDYMEQMKQQVNEVTFNGTILEKIKQNPPAQQPVANPQPQFEENKIEVYDTEKGVVEVIDTPIPVEQVAPKQENAAEPVPVSENAQPAPIPAESESPALVNPHQQLSEEEAIAQQILENTKAQEEIDNVIQQEEDARAKASEAVQKLIETELNNNADEEQPIVLIPGLQPNAE